MNTSTDMNTSAEHPALYDDPDINGLADVLLGSILILFMVVGIPSNVISFVYFFQRARKRAHTVHDILYNMASACDTVTLITVFVPISVLLSDTNRSPMLFGIPAICKLWTVVFYFTSRFSVFIVMMLGACRTIAIRFPFYAINTRVVLYICILYAIFLLVKYGLVLAFGGDTVAYHVNWASCIHFIEGTITILNAFFSLLNLWLLLLLSLSTSLFAPFTSSESRAFPDRMQPSTALSPEASPCSLSCASLVHYPLLP